MYQAENARQVLSIGRKLASVRVSSTVLFLGLTSLFTDISSEMVTAILPLYLVLNLNLSPLAFGMIDGLQLGATAVVRPISGYLADRIGKLKEVAVVGYGLSALSRLGLMIAGGSAVAIASVILIDRLGKGIRTSPRDAMISLNTPKQELATAFGIHRAMDTAGAMLGPLVAFGILFLAPDAYDAVFVVSFCFALIGLAVIALFVRPKRTGRREPAPRVTLREIPSLFVTPSFRSLVFVGTALAFATISDSFLYLTLQRRLNFHVGFFPLLFVASALVYMLLALPIGRLADRLGRARVFICGYFLLGFTYVFLLFPSGGAAEVFFYVLLIGAYYAATDGVLMAMASTALPENLRSTGLALLTTATGLARLAGSILFGLVWTWHGMEVAVGVSMAGLVLAMMLAFTILPFRGGASSDADPTG